MATTAEDLVRLLTQVGQGNRQSFALFYEATSAKLFGVCLQLLKRRDLAEEVLQEVYAKIWAKAADFDAARASPITWVATIARNRCLDELRKKTPVSLDELQETQEFASEEINPLASMENVQDLSALLRCLSQLEEEKKQMILLAYYRGTSREALAQKYAKPVATIKTWLHRSLAQLRTCLTLGASS